jgi:hypothetical protein
VAGAEAAARVLTRQPEEVRHSSHIDQLAVLGTAQYGALLRHLLIDHLSIIG